jgi:hypothetical protein
VKQKKIVQMGSGFLVHSSRACSNPRCFRRTNSFNLLPHGDEHSVEVLKTCKYSASPLCGYRGAKFPDSTPRKKTLSAASTWEDRSGHACRHSWWGCSACIPAMGRGSHGESFKSEPRACQLICAFAAHCRAGPAANHGITE